MGASRDPGGATYHSPHGVGGNRIRHAQALILFFLSVLAGAGRAEWLATANRTGFFGTYSIGGIYEWNERHSVELSLGVYPNGGRNYLQTNAAYRYSRWQYEWEGKAWRPLQVGFFTVRSWDSDHYFLRSPEKYPYENYYDETVLRPGLEFGSALTLRESRLELAYALRILDSGVIAIYNNNKDLQYLISSGLSLRYRF